MLPKPSCCFPHAFPELWYGHHKLAHLRSEHPPFKPESCQSRVTPPPPFLTECSVLNPGPVPGSCSLDLLCSGSTVAQHMPRFPQTEFLESYLTSSFLSAWPFSSNVSDSIFKTSPESNCSASPSQTPLWPRLLPLLGSRHVHVLPGCLSVAAQLTLNDALLVSPCVPLHGPASDVC